MSRTLLDISRAGTSANASWPALAVEVHGYLQNWIAAANSQVSEQQLAVLSAPNPAATAADPCGWKLQATLDQLTPGGAVAVLLLEFTITGTSVYTRTGIANDEPFLGAPDYVGWIYPARDVGASSGSWSTTPLPLNAQVAWSLLPGQEYFLFAYSQHRYTNRMAMPLLIARDQISGHWILAASPPSSSSDALRAVCWNRGSGQPAGSRTFLRDPSPLSNLILRTPAELVIATTDWSSYETANEPAQFWQPLVLPPDFAVMNLLNAAISVMRPADGSEWFAVGSQGVLLRTRDATTGGTPPQGAP
jgi:hypothetical protein